MHDDMCQLKYHKEKENEEEAQWSVSLGLKQRQYQGFKLSHLIIIAGHDSSLYISFEGTNFWAHY